MAAQTATPPPDATADASLLDEFAQLRRVVSEQQATIKDQQAFLELINRERNALLQAIQSGQAPPGAQGMALGVPPPGGIPRQPVQGPPVVQGRDQNADFERARTMMSFMESLAGGGGAGGGSDEYMRLLANAQLARMTAETGLTDVLTTALKEGLKANVRRTVAGALPLFE